MLVLEKVSAFPTYTYSAVPGAILRRVLLFELAVKGIRSACIFLALRPNGLFSAQAQWAFPPETVLAQMRDFYTNLLRILCGGTCRLCCGGKWSKGRDMLLEWRWGGDDALSVILCQVQIWGSSIMGGGSHGTCYLCSQHRSLGPMTSPHLPSSW